MSTSGFELTVAVSDDFVRGLLCSAFEGGSNYWYHNLRVGTLPEGTARADFSGGGRMQPDDTYWHWCQLIPVAGGTVLFDDTEESATYTLGRPQLLQGLRVMQTKHPQHWGNAIMQNGDAETGDIFLQCCVFGNVIYG